MRNLSTRFIGHFVNIQHSNSTIRFWLGLLICLSILFKLLIFLVLRHNGASFVEPDSGTYISPAVTLLQHHHLWSNSALWMRTPGYPVFLAGVFSLFGVQLQAVVIIQILLSGFLTWNAFRTVRLFASVTWAFVAACLVSFDYLYISFSNLVLTDLIFAVLMSFIFFHLLSIFLTKKNFVRSILLLSVYLTVATLIRPISYYLIIIIAAMIVGYSFSRYSLQKSLAILITFMLLPILCVGGWQYRNKQVIGSYAYTSIDAKTIYEYYAAYNIAHEKQISFAKAQQLLKNELNQQQFHSLVAKTHYQRQQGIHILFSYPKWSTLQFMTGFFKTVFGNDYILFFPNQRAFNHAHVLESDLLHLRVKTFFQQATMSDLFKMAMLTLLFLLSFFTIILAVFGFIKLYRTQKQARLALVLSLLVVGYFLLVSSNVCSQARFRLPIELFFDGFASIGLSFACMRQAKRSRLQSPDILKINNTKGSIV